MVDELTEGESMTTSGIFKFLVPALADELHMPDWTSHRKFTQYRYAIEGWINGYRSEQSALAFAGDSSDDSSSDSAEFAGEPVDAEWRALVPLLEAANPEEPQSVESDSDSSDNDVVPNMSFQPTAGGPPLSDLSLRPPSNHNGSASNHSGEDEDSESEGPGDFVFVDQFTDQNDDPNGPVRYWNFGACGYNHSTHRFLFGPMNVDWLLHMIYFIMFGLYFLVPILCANA